MVVIFDGPAQHKARESLLPNRTKWLEKLAHLCIDAGILSPLRRAGASRSPMVYNASENSSLTSVLHAAMLVTALIFQQHLMAADSSLPCATLVGA